MWHTAYCLLTWNDFRKNTTKITNKHAYNMIQTQDTTETPNEKTRETQRNKYWHHYVSYWYTLEGNPWGVVVRVQLNSSSGGRICGQTKHMFREPALLRGTKVPVPALSRAFPLAGVGVCVQLNSSIGGYTMRPNQVHISWTGITEGHRSACTGIIQGVFPIMPVRHLYMACLLLCRCSCVYSWTAAVVGWASVGDSL